MRVPREVADAVVRAAAAVPAHAGDLDAVRRRGRARVRARRRLAAAAAVAVLAVSLPFAYLRQTGTALVEPVASAPIASPSPSVAPPPAQRLLLSMAGVSMKAMEGGGLSTGIVSGGGIGEVLPDGRVVRHPVSAVDGVYDVVARPDGTLVLLGYVDHMKGVARTDGPNVKGLTFDLVVQDEDGAVVRRRDVRVMGESVELVNATATTAYLARNDVLVAHELATGSERTVLTLKVDKLTVDLVGGWVATLSGDRGCAGEIYDLARGRPHARFGVNEPECTVGSPVRLSPDGRLVAVSTMTTSGREFTHRLRVFDTQTGEIRGEQVIQRVADMRAVTTIGKGLYGMAWSDNYTVRYAFAELPPDARRVYQVEELLRVDSLRIGG